MPAASDVLGRFSPATRAWFGSAFEAATAAQVGAWDAISSGQHALVVAPTGSGKTLAAFLWALDRARGRAAPGRSEGAAAACSTCRRSRPSPSTSSATCAARSPASDARPCGSACPSRTSRVGVRSGDTPADERRRFATRPPDILITTPESLFLLLTSQARESLRGVAHRDRRRGARGGRHQARRAPRALARAARRPARAAGAAHRPVGHRAPGRRGRDVPRRLAPGHGRAAAVARRRSTSRSSCRSTTWPSSAPRRARSTARPPATSGVRRSGRTSRSASSTSSPRTGRPSCSPTRAGSPSASPRGSTRSGSSAPPARRSRPARRRRRSWARPAPPAAHRRCWPARTTAR